MKYPIEIRTTDVAGRGDFAPGKYKIVGGRAMYDEVVLLDGGNAAYLVRIESTTEGLRIIRRWISWDTPLLQMFADDEDS